MFDNLRDDSRGLKEEGQAKLHQASGTASGSIAPRSSRFLGMTSIQRFVIAVLILAAVCVLGAMCLLVTGKIVF